MKVMTVVGTRPEIIRLSRVMARLDSMVDHVLVHTGQNWDHQLNEVFFEELELRRPNYVLDIDTSTLGSVMGDILRKIEEVLVAEKPDAFLVLGDTNSAIAAVMAKRMKVPVFHMEAGNRCFDENVPEETNRRLVDHVSDFNLVYTEHARRNLLAEGIHPRRIMLTGSPMREVLTHYLPAVQDSDILSRLGLSPKNYLLASAHREENVDDPDRLRALLGCLTSAAADTGLPVLISTHPRTRRRLEALDQAITTDGPLKLHDPFGFIDYTSLQQNAYCVLSDSGTISEEAAMLSVPAVTLRPSIERPEALDAGSITLADLRPDEVVRAIQAALTLTGASSVPAEYDIPNTSARVVNFIISVAPQHSTWSGLRASSSE